MTRAEILKCLTDRPCDVCKFHESGKCERWECVFEERAEEQEDDALGMTKEELAHFINATKDKWHFTTESGKEVSAEQIIKTLSKGPCEDAISRQAVDDAIYDYSRSCDVDYGQIMEYINKLPSVTPKQRTGHWIKVDDEEPIAYDCSECGAMVSRRYKFCLNCGAKMEDTE